MPSVSRLTHFIFCLFCLQHIWTNYSFCLSLCHCHFIFNNIKSLSATARWLSASVVMLPQQLLRPYDRMPASSICSTSSAGLMFHYTFISRLIKWSEYYLALMPLIQLRLFNNAENICRVWYINATYMQLNN